LNRRHPWRQQNTRHDWRVTCILGTACAHALDLHQYGGLPV